MTRIFSEEHRRKLSEANKRRNWKGENHPFWGKKMNFKNPEQRNRNISLEKMGKTHKGTPLSEETKRKISLAHMGKKLSQESIRKRTLATSGERAYQWKGGMNMQTRKKYAPRPKPEQCEICNIFGKDLKKGLCYDHNHKTGEFRGWICMHCNFALGNVKDNIEILLAMIEYLKKGERDI